MAKKKKLSRKELLNRPDEFITISAKVIEFVNTYQMQLFFGCILCIVLVVSIIGVRYYSTKAEKQASDMFAMMMAKYEFVKSKNGPVAGYESIDKESQVLLNEFSSREGGKLARVLYADICYQAGQVDKAIELYTKAINQFRDTSVVKVFVLNGLAYCYEEKNDYKTAVTYYQKIVSGPDNSIKGEALYNIGRLYAEMGEKEKSIEAFNRVLSDYSDSIYADLIKEKLSS